MVIVVDRSPIEAGAQSAVEETLQRRAAWELASANPFLIAEQSTTVGEGCHLSEAGGRGSPSCSSKGINNRFTNNPPAIAVLTKAPK